MGVTLNPDGTTTLTFDGTEIRLRVPTTGEFVRFHDATLDWADRLTVHVDEVRRNAEGAELTVEERLEQRRAGRALQDELRRHRSAWWGDVCSTLAGTDLVDDPPAWLVVSPDAINRVLLHWMTCPEASGA